MKIKLWIIHKSGIGFSKIIAEMLGERLEMYIDVSVGNAIKIDPYFIIEEKSDCLIIGDVINEANPSPEIQDWLLKYSEYSNDSKFIIKILSSFYITAYDIKTESIWFESLQENINAEMIYPPIVRIKLNKTGFALEDEAFELVRAYSDDFIKFLIKL